MNFKQTDKLRGKKLLILAGTDIHCKVVRTAKEMGVYTIVTDYWNASASPAKQIADEAWELDVKDIDAIVRRCQAEQVNGVLNYAIDPAQIPYQQVCERLKLPCYGTKKQFALLTNKRRFKEYCLGHGVDIVPEYSENDAENGNIHYPVLVKPSDSRGSRGQTVCFRRDELREAIAFARRESSEGEVLIERYMQGKQDFSVVYFITNWRPYIVKMGDRYLGRQEDGLERQCICTTYPSRQAIKYKETIEPKVLKLLEALDIKFGVVSLQGFFDNDRICFYDPAIRFPGSDFDLAVKRASGFDPIKSMILFSLTGDIKSCEGTPENAYLLNGKYCITLAVAVKPGRIAVFSGWEIIEANPAVLSVSKRSGVGEIIPATGDIKQRVAEITALLPDRDSINSFAQFVYGSLSILDDNGEDMIVSKMGVQIPFEKAVAVALREID